MQIYLYLFGANFFITSRQQSIFKFFHLNIQITSLKTTAHLADATGRVILGGASLAGIAALCYYGLGLSNEIGAVDRAR